MPLKRAQIDSEEVYYRDDACSIMIYRDRDTEKVIYFNTPYELSQLTLGDKKIYDIDFKHGVHYRLMYMDLGIQ